MSKMNYEAARYNMLEQQIRPWELLDDRSLDVMAQVPREAFVPAAFKALAFSDMEIPLEHNQFMLAPKIEAKILQATQIRPTDTVLEIGTGSGYLSALLAKQAAQVQSMDIHSDFIELASERLQQLGIDNVSFQHKDVYDIQLDEQQYDVIIVGGSVTNVPDSWKQALKQSGRMFVVCGEPPVMSALLISRVDNEQFMQASLFETQLPSLEQKTRIPVFEF